MSLINWFFALLLCIVQSRSSILSRVCPAWVTPGDLCTWCQGLFWALRRSDWTFWSKKWRRRAHSWHTSSFTLLLASKGQYFKISRCLCHVCLSMFQCFYQPGLDSIFTEIKFQLGFILLACQVQSLAADLKKFQDRNFLSWESPKYSMKLEIFWSKEIRAKRQTVDITCTEHAKVPSGSLAKGIKYKKTAKVLWKSSFLDMHLTSSDHIWPITFLAFTLRNHRPLNGALSLQNIARRLAQNR